MRTTDVKLGATLASLCAVTIAAPLMAHAQKGTVLQQKGTPVVPAPAGKAPVASSPHVYVFGAVAKQGRYDLKPGDRTVDAIADAGGFLPGANTDRVGVIRVSADKKTTILRKIDVGSFMRKGDMKGNILVAPGDTIYVSKKRA